MAWLAAAVLPLLPAPGTASNANPALPRGPRAILPAGRVPTVPSRAHLDYHGGHVISNVQVVMVLWGPGSYAPFVTSTGPRSIASFFAGVTASPYLDLLGQYATVGPAVDGRAGSQQPIGRGTFGSRIQISPSETNGGARIDDGNIVAELSAQLAAGALPPPVTDAAGNSSTVYAIYFPAGKTITLGNGVACVTFCAYHGTFAWKGREVYYLVMPDMSPGSGCDVGCGSEAMPFDLATSVASHELAEAITDPEVGLSTGVGAPIAWYDATNGEIGDVCNALDGTITAGDGATYVVQKLWSNADGACVASPAPAGAAIAAAASTWMDAGHPASASPSSAAPVRVRARNVSPYPAMLPAAPPANGAAAPPAAPARPEPAAAAASAEPATTAVPECTCVDPASASAANHAQEGARDAGASAPTPSREPSPSTPASGAPSSPQPDRRP